MICEKVKSTIPFSDIEQGALDQIQHVASMPAVKKLAIMPDAHAGYTLPIGGVALVEGHISPEFVGYDIGCGMCSYNLGTLPDTDWHDVYNEILQVIPVGVGRHNEGLTPEVPGGLSEELERLYVRSFHSLGGGNHFIEIGRNERGEYAISIHSGSRGFGHTIGTVYMEKSQQFQNGLIPEHSELFHEYLHFMNMALELALANRLAIMRTVAQIVGRKLDVHGVINENHNHAVVTPEGILHRKGATPAEKGQLGIIPINQRDGVYITRGLGNEDFLCSASHGAGRKLSRSKAKKTISLQLFQEQMQGIVCRTDKDVLDEAPDAYKDADTVIGIQKGLLVDVVDHFKPVMVVKG